MGREVNVCHTLHKHFYSVGLKNSAPPSLILPRALEHVNLLLRGNLREKAFNRLCLFCQLSVESVYAPCKRPSGHQRVSLPRRRISAVGIFSRRTRSRWVLLAQYEYWGLGICRRCYSSGKSFSCAPKPILFGSRKRNPFVLPRQRKQLQFLRE